MRRALPLLLTLLLLGVALAIVFLPLHEEVTPNAQPQKRTFTLKMAHNTPTDSALHEASLRFAQLVAQKSGGALQVEVYPAQILGNDHQMVEMARRGEIDILLTPTAKMSVALPSMQYADLPFYFPAPQDLYEMLDGAPGQLLLEELSTVDLVGVTFWENGFKHFSANTPLLCLEDFEGKRMRVMKSRLIMEQFKLLGSEPVAIDFHTTLEALRDGVVEGQENPLVAFVSMGFHEVQSDLTLSAHGYLGYLFSVSAKTFDVLPLQMRAYLMQSAREVTPWERAQTATREAQLLEEIRAKGVRIHTLSEEERARFADRMSGIAKRFESIIGAHIISETERLLRLKYGPFECHLIGIDADLSGGSKAAGLGIKRGVELAVEQINAEGGLLGKPLCIEARDHGGMPERGMENLKAFYANPQTIAVVGGVQSAAVMGEMPQIRADGRPYLLPWAAASELVAAPPHTLFRVSANDCSVAPFLLEEALKRFKKPAVLVENSVWGRSNLEKIQKHAASRGLEPFEAMVINQGQSRLDDAVAQMVQSGADGVLMVLSPSEAGLLVEALSRLDTPIGVVSHWGVTNGDFFAAHQKALAKVELHFLQTFLFGRGISAQSQALHKRYQERYDQISYVPDLAVAQAYDAVQMLAFAARAAQSAEADKLVSALEGIVLHEGVLKEYHFPFADPKHDALVREDYFMARFDRDGKVVALP